MRTLKIDGGIGGSMGRIPEVVRRLEQTGYSAGWTAETSKDPFLPLVLAAEHTETLELGTGIAVAFSRNPATVAQLGRDLQDYSGGRLMLGLGSQVRAHIERRFSMPWGRPAARMREFILAMRAIWDCWQGEAELDFRGEFYTHTLMPPFFNPGPSEFGPPRVFLAAVGERMTQVCGEVADGMLVHAFTTERYLREVTLPALDVGLAASGRDRKDLQLSCPVFVLTGADDDQRAAAASGLRKQIAFYASTPAYRSLLELHGWDDLGPQLTRMSKAGQWDEMAALISDDVLETFAVVAEPDDVARAMEARYGGLLDRISLYTPYRLPKDVVGAVVAGFTGGRQ